MKNRYKKTLIIMVIIALVIPQMTFGAWYNPLSWSVFSWVRERIQMSFHQNPSPSTQEDTSQKIETQTQEVAEPKQESSDPKKQENPLLLSPKPPPPTTTEKPKNFFEDLFSEPPKVTQPETQVQNLPVAPTPPPNSKLCNGIYYSFCPASQDFVCPSNGGAYCQSQYKPVSPQPTPTQPTITPDQISEQPIESSIDGEFNGWEGETIYKLINGQYWQQSAYHYHYHYAYSPKVLIYGSNLNYKMHVVGDNDKDVSVQQVYDVIESRIDGEFKGWEGETIYALTNGQIWQQSAYHYHYHYAYNPGVYIYPSNGGFKMHVLGDNDQEISVRRIK